MVFMLATFKNHLTRSLESLSSQGPPPIQPAYGKKGVATVRWAGPNLFVQKLIVHGVSLLGAGSLHQILPDLKL